MRWADPDNEQDTNSARQGEPQAVSSETLEIGTMAASGLVPQSALGKAFGVAEPGPNEDGWSGMQINFHHASPIYIGKYEDPDSDAFAEVSGVRIPFVDTSVAEAVREFDSDWRSHKALDSGFELERRQGVVERTNLDDSTEAHEFSQFRAFNDDGERITLEGKTDLSGGVNAAGENTEIAARLDRVGVVEEGTVVEHLADLLDSRTDAIDADVVSGVREDGSEFVEVLAAAEAKGSDDASDVHRYIYEDGTVTHITQSRVLPEDYDGVLREQVEATRTVDEFEFDPAGEGGSEKVDRGRDSGNSAESPDSGDTLAPGLGTHPAAGAHIDQIESDDGGKVDVSTLDETFSTLPDSSHVLTLDEQVAALGDINADSITPSDAGHVDMPSQEDNLAVYGFPMDDADEGIASVDEAVAALPAGGVAIDTLDETLADLPADEIPADTPDAETTIVTPGDYVDGFDAAASDNGDGESVIVDTSFLDSATADSDNGAAVIADTSFLARTDSAQSDDSASSRGGTGNATGVQAAAGVQQVVAGMQTGSELGAAAGMLDLAASANDGAELAPAGGALSSASGLGRALAADNEWAAAGHALELGDDLGGFGDGSVLGSAGSALGGLASVAQLDDAIDDGRYDAVLQGTSTAAGMAGEALGSTALTGAADAMGSIAPGVGVATSLAEGDAVGAAIGAVSMANPVVGIGLSVASTVLGGLFGDDDPPPPPEAKATLGLDDHGRLAVTGASDAHGGNGGSLAVTAQQAADLFNGMVASTGGRLLDTEALGEMTLGHEGEDVYVASPGVRALDGEGDKGLGELLGHSLEQADQRAGDKVRFDSVSDAAEYLALDALAASTIEGGDIHARRALAHQLDAGAGAEEVLGALETAHAYSRVEQQRPALERAAEAPETAAELARYEAGEIERGDLGETAARVVEAREIEARAERLGLDTPHPSESDTAANRAFADNGVDLAGVAVEDLVLELEPGELNIAIADPERPDASVRDLPHARLDATADDFDAAALHLPDSGLWRLGDLIDATGVESSSGPVVVGEALAERFAGGDGAQVRLGGAAEAASGSTADETLIGLGGSTLEGLQGDDTFISRAPGDRILGGAGTDTVDYSGSDDGIDVDLRAGYARGGDAEGDVLGSIEAIVASAHDDVLIGESGDNQLMAGAGDDIVAGHEGSDHLSGGPGADRLDPGPGGRSVALGGEGDDILVGHGDGAVLHGGDGSDAVVYEGSITDWALARQGDSVFVERAAGDGGRDQLNEIGLVQFADAAVAIDEGAEALAGDTPTLSLDEAIALQARATVGPMFAGGLDGGSAELPGVDAAPAALASTPESVSADDGGSDGDDVIVERAGRGGGNGPPREARNAFNTGEAAALGVVAAGLPVVIDSALADGIDAETDSRHSSRDESDGHLVAVAPSGGEAVEGDAALRFVDIDAPIEPGEDNAAPRVDFASTGEGLASGTRSVIDGSSGPPEVLLQAPFDEGEASIRSRPEALPREPHSAPEEDEPRAESGEATVDTPTERIASLFNVVNGTPGDDVLEGTSAADWIEAGAGDDLIVAGSGGDVILAGEGRDTLSYEASPEGVAVELGADTLGRGGYAEDDHIDGVEILHGSPHGDELRVAPGASGDFTLEGGAGDDFLQGGSGADELVGGAGDDELFAGKGDNVLRGGEGDDVLVAAEGDDVLRANAGNNRLYGGDGDDELIGGSGHDYLEAGEGDNVLRAGDPATPQGTSEAPADSNDENARGDTLVGGAGHDRLIGGAGDDTLRAGGEGSAGDELIAGSGDDSLHAGAGDDILRAGAGNDTLVATEGDNALHGGSGSDRLTGGAGEDRLVAGTGDNTLIAGSGDDVLVSGESGLDTLLGGRGDNRLIGRAKDDFAFFDGGGGDNTLALERGDTGEPLAVDVSAAQNIDAVEGTRGDDDITVDTEVDRVDLGEGFDRVTLDADPFDFADVAVDGEAGEAVLERDDGSSMEIHAEELRFRDGEDSRTLFLDGRNNPPLVDAPRFEVTENGALELDADDLLAGVIDVDDDPVSLDSVGSVDAALSRGVANTYSQSSKAPEFTPARDVDFPVYQFGTTVLQEEASPRHGKGPHTDSLDSHLEPVTEPVGPRGLQSEPVIESAGPRPDPTREAGPGDELVHGHMLEELTQAVREGSPHGRPAGNSIERRSSEPFHDDNELIGNAQDNVFVGGGGDNEFKGRGGSNSVDYSGSGDPVTVDLRGGEGSGGWAEGDTYRNIDGVRGSSGDDELRAHDQGAVLIGGGGDDVLIAGAGDDMLIGGSGYDVAEFDGRREDYDIEANGDHVVVQRRHGENSGAENHLHAVEGLRFADTTESIGRAAVNAGTDGAGPGTLTFDDGTFVYEPDDDFFEPRELAERADNGELEDGFAERVDLPFTVSDEHGAATTASGDVEVEWVNEAPELFEPVDYDGTRSTERLGRPPGAGRAEGGGWDPPMSDRSFTVAGGEGRILARDREETAEGIARDGDGFTFSLVEGPEHGRLDLDPDTGEFSYALNQGDDGASWESYTDTVCPHGQRGRPAHDHDVVGAAGGRNGPCTTQEEWRISPERDPISENEAKFIDFTVEIEDSMGESTTEEVTLKNDSPSSGGGKKPVALDLDDSGLDFRDIDDSDVLADVNGDGAAERSAWVGEGTGLLALDRDGDDEVDLEGFREISFVDDHPDARTDLEGLALAFDSNDDGVLDADDERWDDFHVWNDASGDGETGPGELMTMAEAGIEAIDLSHRGESYTDGDVDVLGTTFFERADGSRGTVGDTAFAYESADGEESADPAAAIAGESAAEAGGGSAATATDALAEAQAARLIQRLAGERGERGDGSGEPALPLDVAAALAADGDVRDVETTMA